ncbi:Mov34/MPN/PAD-1 family protein [Halorubellus sp. PRR65]|uniref:Mov34/MPN/PAD-1 family protein n=1 Tax=Halorubellus sp. PRR65 TaxID=3098148 RepID=UPI002B25E904|nr:Mov34/MPN/PAD-1 family protein [Halorubellus sp. PRR65]
MGLFDRFFRSRDVAGIARDTLEFALSSAEDTHPNEYMGFMRGTPAREFDLGEEIHPDDYVVTDVLVIPGTTSNEMSATVDNNMIPNDMRTVGSIHSHPNGVLKPSDADLATFTSGSVHVIMGAPYRRSDWRAFDQEGDATTLPVLDVDLDDPEAFFDFDQYDIDDELRSGGNY